MYPLRVLPSGLIGTIDLNNNKITNNTDNPIKFQCQITGQCCKRNQIPVTEEEISRIKSHGKKNFVSDLPPVETPLETTYWMKRIDDKCIFLEGNKCGIHDFKPFSCSVYPFKIIETEERVFDVIISETSKCENVTNSETETMNNEENLKFLMNLLRKEIEARKD